MPFGISVNAGYCQRDLDMSLNLAATPTWAIGWLSCDGLPTPLRPNSAEPMLEADLEALTISQRHMTEHLRQLSPEANQCRLCGRYEDSTEHLLHWCPVVGTCLDLLTNVGGHGERAYLSGSIISSDILVVLFLEQLMLLCQQRRLLSPAALHKLLHEQGPARSTRALMTGF